MADPVTASIAQAALSGVGNFIKNDLIDRIFGSIFGGGGSDLPPLTPEQQAALEVSNALNMAQGDLYGDGQNEGFLEIVGPTFEEAVRKVQALDDSEEKTDLLSVLANNAPYDFTDLTPASITGLEVDDLSNPLITPNPLLVEQAVNTGPFVEDDDPNQKAIDAFIDLISGKYKKDKNDITPIDVAGVGTILAGQGSDNQAGTPTGGTPQCQIGTPQGETSTPQGSTPIPQGGTPQGGTPTSDTAAVDSPIGTPTVSTGSVLDQTDTVDVKVDDQPTGLLNIPTTVPKQPEKKAGMIMQISQSAPIVETVFDDILFEPRFTRLDNIPDFNLPSGLLRTLV